MGRCRQTGPDNGHDLLAFAVCCVAGPLARQHLLGNQKFVAANDGDDLEQAHGILSRIGLDGVDALKALLPFTRLLIERNWPDIERIAGQLVVNKMLSYDEVVSLIER